MAGSASVLVFEIDRSFIAGTNGPNKILFAVAAATHATTKQGRSGAERSAADGDDDRQPRAMILQAGAKRKSPSDKRPLIDAKISIRNQ